MKMNYNRNKRFGSDCKSGRIEKRNANHIGGIALQVLRHMGLSEGLNRHKVFCAWDEVSMVGAATIGKFFKDGVLYVTISSSVVRSALFRRKEWIRSRINAKLTGDDMFYRKNKKDFEPVKNIILK